MKLSVIVPTRDRENLLLVSVGSTASLRSIPCELIIIDDGSEESSEARFVTSLKECASTSELPYLSQANLGAQFARNRGLEASTGDMIMFVDDDDVVVPIGIVYAVEEPVNYSADFVHGIVKLVDASRTHSFSLHLIHSFHHDSYGASSCTHWRHRSTEIEAKPDCF